MTRYHQYSKSFFSFSTQSFSFSRKTFSFLLSRFLKNTFSSRQTGWPWKHDDKESSFRVFLSLSPTATHSFSFSLFTHLMHTDGKEYIYYLVKTGSWEPIMWRRAKSSPRVEKHKTTRRRVASLGHHDVANEGVLPLAIVWIKCLMSLMWTYFLQQMEKWKVLAIRWRWNVSCTFWTMKIS